MKEALFALLWVGFIFFYILPKPQPKRIESVPPRRKPKKYK
jgi:hypothetical protein